MDPDNVSTRESRATSYGPGKTRRSSIVASATTASPLHGDSHNTFIRYCEAHTIKTFWAILIFITVIGIMGAGITFSREDVIVGKRSSGLILSSGEGMIARINSYVIDIPDAECKGEISTYPDGRYSSTLLDVASEDSGDDFLRPRDCKWLSGKSGASFTNTTFPTNLVGGCNAYPVATGYTESISVVFEGSDLLSASSLVGMCDVDRMIRNYDNYLDSKCRNSGVTGEPCCPSRSIGNYAAALFGLDACEDITDDTASQLADLLDTCREVYRTGGLTGDCWDWKRGELKATQCPLATTECARYNAVYDIFHSLGNSVISQEGNTEPLTIARLQVPFNSTNYDWLSDLYYDKMRFKTNEKYGGAEIKAYDLRIKSEVFGNFISWDAFFFIPITVLSVLGILAFDHSLFAAVCVVFSIYVTFGMTLFVVGVVMWISYIPFFVFFVISISLYVGLGFFFLLSSNWKDSFDSLGVAVNDADRMAFVWHHTSLKTFASALCSGVGFFTAILFPLPSIKVFGLFCGISVVMVFLVANFFFPLIVIMDHQNERSDNFFFGRIRFLDRFVKFDWCKIFTNYDKIYNWKGTILLLLAIGTIAVGSYSFIMRMETVSSAQLLFTQHPFERYDRKYSMKFNNDPMNRHGYFDFSVVFGVRDKNTIKAFNPDKRQPVSFDELNITSVDTQRIMYDLCEDLVREKGNGELALSIQNVRCYPLFFTQWMQAPCVNTVDADYPDTSTWLTPKRVDCCGNSVRNVTFAEDVFSRCMFKWSKEYGSFDTGVFWNPNSPDPNNPEMKAVSFSVESDSDFSTDYGDSIDYWDESNDWLSDKIKGTTIHSGFFTANAELLRYQRGLRVGLKLVAPLSISVSALVVMFMTRNIISGLSFLLTVLFVLWAVSGSLQILGEKFSLFTAVVATMGTGLACQSASLVSHAFCEAGSGPGTIKNVQLGQDVLIELGPSSLMTTLVLCLSSVCLLGGNNYYTFAFGAAFILIVFYIIVLPQWWNLLFLSTCWLKHPFGELATFIGVSPPPCCMLDPEVPHLEAEMGDIYHRPTEASTTMSPFATKHIEQSGDVKGSKENASDTSEEEGGVVDDAGAGASSNFNDKPCDDVVSADL